MAQSWTKERPTVPGLYKWRKPHMVKGMKKPHYGYVLVDSDGYYYDLAIGRLRRFHLNNVEDATNRSEEWLKLYGETEWKLVHRSGGEDDRIEPRTTPPIVLDMVSRRG